MKRVVIGSDHGGFALKEVMVSFLRERGVEVRDFGCYSTDPVDYPDIAMLVAQAVAKEQGQSLGIVIDGVGAGSAIAANKIRGARAAAAYDTFSAGNARRHNNANILTLGSRVTGEELAKAIVTTFVESEFEGGRHERRVEKILSLEQKFCGTWE